MWRTVRSWKVATNSLKNVSVRFFFIFDPICSYIVTRSTTRRFWYVLCWRWPIPNVKRILWFSLKDSLTLGQKRGRRQIYSCNPWRVKEQRNASVVKNTIASFPLIRSYDYSTVLCPPPQAEGDGFYLFGSLCNQSTNKHEEGTPTNIKADKQDSLRCTISPVHRIQRTLSIVVNT